jgi:hypothetical protein
MLRAVGQAPRRRPAEKAWIIEQASKRVRELQVEDRERRMQGLPPETKSRNFTEGQPWVRSETLDMNASC